MIDGREVDPKMAVPREEMDTGSRGVPPHMALSREGRRNSPRAPLHLQVTHVLVPLDFLVAIS